MLLHSEASFDGTMTTFNKKLSAAKVGCAALRWNQGKVLSKQKTSETDLGESLKFLPLRTNDCSSIMLKKFGTKVSQGLEKIFEDFNFEAGKVSGELNTFLSLSTSCVKRQIANCVAMLFQQLESVCEASSVNYTASVLSTSPAATGCAPSTSADLSFKEGPQKLNSFRQL